MTGEVQADTRECKALHTRVRNANIYMVRNGRQTGQKVVTADASLDTEIPLGSGCRLVYICNAILITLSIFDTDYSAVSADSV